MADEDDMSTDVPTAVASGLVLLCGDAKSLSWMVLAQYETLAPSASRVSTTARPIPFVPPSLRVLALLKIDG